MFWSELRRARTDRGGRGRDNLRRSPKPKVETEGLVATGRRRARLLPGMEAPEPRGVVGASKPFAREIERLKRNPSTLHSFRMFYSGPAPI